VLLAAAIVRIPDDAWRAMFEPFGSGAATDLKKRWIEVQAWFIGAPVYGTIETADYPPGAYPLLWLLTGWSSLPTARVVWTIVNVVILAVTMALIAATTKNRTRAEQIFMTLLAPALYATSATIRIGQTGLMALAGILAAGLLSTTPRTWHRDGGIAVLLSVALMKPTFTAPFFWFFLFVAGIRAGALTVLGFALLTALGASFQGGDIIALARGWLAQGDKVEYLSAHGNMHTWLGGAGLSAFILPASLLTLAIAGIWSWQNRTAPWWLQLGVLAVVARIWTYHRWYDDILMLFVALALFLMVTSAEWSRRTRWTAFVLGALLVGCGIAPARILKFSEEFKTLKTATMLLSGALLIWQARRFRSAARSASYSAAPRSLESPA
jgi:hypothetical protein